VDNIKNFGEQETEAYEGYVSTRDNTIAKKCQSQEREEGNLTPEFVLVSTLRWPEPA